MGLSYRIGSLYGNPACMKGTVMSDKQYAVLCVLFHEYNDAFKALPSHILDAYYKRLYQGK